MNKFNWKKLKIAPALASINLLRKIIILEQYLILTLNPSLNTVKVVNTAPYTDHSDLSPEKWNKMVTSMSQPIYLYLDDVLVFEAPSAAVGARQLGIGAVSFFRNMVLNYSDVILYHESGLLRILK